MSLDGLFKEIHRKVPAISVLPKAQLQINQCNFKGDTTNDADTCGILIIKADASIIECNFAHHKSGAIMMDLDPQNKIAVIKNHIISCETAGIYA